MHARPRLTYANVVSTLALVIAMSTGGAYAASLIRTSQIADGAVTTPKLSDGAVRPAKIDANAVQRSKLDNAAVGSAELVTGAVTAPKIGAGAVTGAKVAEGSIRASDLGISARRPPAYARVSSDPFEVTGSGITAQMITRPVLEGQQDPVAGVYCFHDLPFAPAAVSVTSSLNFAGPTMATATHGQPPPCPAGTQLMVKLYVNSSTPIDGTFNIIIWP